jgi:hypothetical protein
MDLIRQIGSDSSSNGGGGGGVEETREIQTTKRRKTKGSVNITASTEVPPDTFAPSVAHHSGHWAGHIGIPIPDTSFWKRQKMRSIHKFKALLEKNGYSGTLVEHVTMHVSLSKQFSLQISRIESFRKQLVVLLQQHHATSLHLDMDHPFLLTNDEDTQSFWCWKVLADPTLLKIVGHIDSTLAKHQQQPYYQPPDFHVSIASFPGKVEFNNMDMEHADSSKELAGTMSFVSNTLAVTHLQCNFGTIQNFMLPLKEKYVVIHDATSCGETENKVSSTCI